MSIGAPEPASPAPSSHPPQPVNPKTLLLLAVALSSLTWAVTRDATLTAAVFVAVLAMGKPTTTPS